jgi:dolichyl-phosphate beta-glucosyltransferase
MWAVLLFLLVLVLVLAVLVIKFLPQEKNDFTWVNEKRAFYDPNKEALVPFPSYKEKAVVHLSVIVPAYNEQERIPIMLEETLEFLKGREKKNPELSWEIVVIDDGSRDKTCDIVQQFSKRETTERVRVVKLEKNLGKGGALKVGMLLGRGKYLLMADADAATKFSDVKDLKKASKTLKKILMGLLWAHATIL